jgi:integrase
MNRKHRPMHPSIRMSAITTPDVFRLLETASTRKAYLLTALACTGARASEIAALRWEDVDLRRRLIRIGDRTCERLVPMPIFLADALERYRASQEERSKGPGEDSAAAASFVFQSRSGGALQPHTLAQRFRLHTMRTLGRPLAPHQMRAWALRRITR